MDGEDAYMPDLNDLIDDVMDDMNPASNSIDLALSNQSAFETHLRDVESNSLDGEKSSQSSGVNESICVATSKQDKVSFVAAAVEDLEANGSSELACAAGAVGKQDVPALKGASTKEAAGGVDNSYGTSANTKEAAGDKDNCGRSNASTKEATGDSDNGGGTSASTKEATGDVDNGGGTTASTKEATNDVDNGGGTSASTKEASEDVDDGGGTSASTKEAADDVDNSDGTSASTKEAAGGIDNGDGTSASTKEAAGDVDNGGGTNPSTKEAADDVDNSDGTSASTKEAAGDVDNSDGTSASTKEAAGDVDNSDGTSVNTKEAADDVSSGDGTSANTKEAACDVGNGDGTSATTKEAAGGIDNGDRTTINRVSDAENSTETAEVSVVQNDVESVDITEISVLECDEEMSSSVDSVNAGLVSETAAISAPGVEVSKEPSVEPAALKSSDSNMACVETPTDGSRKNITPGEVDKTPSADAERLLSAETGDKSSASAVGAAGESATLEAVNSQISPQERSNSTERVQSCTAAEGGTEVGHRGVSAASDQQQRSSSAGPTRPSTGGVVPVEDISDDDDITLVEEVTVGDADRPAKPVPDTPPRRIKVISEASLSSMQLADDLLISDNSSANRSVNQNVTSSMIQTNSGQTQRGQCFVCQKITDIRYVLMGEIAGMSRFICGELCLNAFTASHSVVNRSFTQSPPGTASELLLASAAVSPPATAAAGGPAPSCAPPPPCLEPHDHSKCDTDCASCRQCRAHVPLRSQKRAVWETDIFCSISCTVSYQRSLGMKCVSCGHKFADSVLGKFCVRFGGDVRQFCTAICLDVFKKRLKACCYCQRDITNYSGSFLAPVGTAQFKEFCSQSCFSRYKTAHNGVEESWDVCAVCFKHKPVRHEVAASPAECVKKLCSQPCLRAYKFVISQSGSLGKCSVCSTIFVLENMRQFYVNFGTTSAQLCSSTCCNVYVITHRRIVSCASCKVKKYNFDMVEVSLYNLMYCSVTCLVNCGQQVSNSIGETAGSTICFTCKTLVSKTPFVLPAKGESGSQLKFCSKLCARRHVSASKQKGTSGKQVSPAVTTATTTRRSQSRTRNLRSSQPVPAPQEAPSSSPPSPGHHEMLVDPISGQLHIAAGSSLPTAEQQRAAAARPKELEEPEDRMAAVCQQLRRLLPTAGWNVACQTRPSAVSVSTQTDAQTVAERKDSAEAAVSGDASGRKDDLPVPPKTSSTSSTQTSPDQSVASLSGQPVPIPLFVPVPIYVPVPMAMYNCPYPVPVPFPLPIPVPLVIPTDKSMVEAALTALKELQSLQSVTDGAMVSRKRSAAVNSTSVTTNSTSDTTNSASDTTNSTSVTTNSTGVITGSTNIAMDSTSSKTGLTSGNMTPTSSTSASKSSITASTSSTTALKSSVTASTSANTASKSATAASKSSITASTSPTTALKSSITASTSATTASKSSTKASNSATTASKSSTTVSTSATTALKSATTALKSTTTVSKSSTSASTGATTVSSSPTSISKSAITVSKNSTTASTSTTTTSTNSSKASTSVITNSTSVTMGSTNAVGTSTAGDEKDDYPPAKRLKFGSGDGVELAASPPPASPLSPGGVSSCSADPGDGDAMDDADPATTLTDADQSAAAADADTADLCRLMSAPRGTCSQLTDAVATSYSLGAATDQLVDRDSCVKTVLCCRVLNDFTAADLLKGDSSSSRVLSDDQLHVPAAQLPGALQRMCRQLRRPNGQSYPPDLLYYIVLGISTHLLKRGSRQLLLDQVELDPISTALDAKLAVMAAELINCLSTPERYVICTHIEEKHLWESKLLGARTPFSILYTLLYFNTKLLTLSTVEMHEQLRFSWFRLSECGQKLVVSNIHGGRGDYALSRNIENAYHCPLQFFNFYKSRCTVSALQCSGIYYQPVPDCVPNCDLWFCARAVSRHCLQTMLNRILCVREVQLALLRHAK